ncbi:hypothetical protein EOJ36_02935 [Sandaracinomonas limnophila]|uniref:Uncharacterized protein n=1 Tax=Sandaracinomonas limnophila TaxID=1862386 RepID=A0A437PXM7_9BACT|nr:hypothetical protein [Sandaracinomonas limnophila]RVU26968.1 hypothetical protein EOJ36_02935 [Sandaracinomonas limnophila]
MEHLFQKAIFLYMINWILFSFIYLEYKRINAGFGGILLSSGYGFLLIKTYTKLTIPIQLFGLYLVNKKIDLNWQENILIFLTGWIGFYSIIGQILAYKILGPITLFFIYLGLILIPIICFYL